MLVSAARTSRQATLTSGLNRAWASQRTQNTSLRLRFLKTLSKNWFLTPCNRKKDYLDQTSHWEPTTSTKTCITFSHRLKLCKSHFKNTGMKVTLSKTCLNQNSCWKTDEWQAYNSGPLNRRIILLKQKANLLINLASNSTVTTPKNTK